MVLSSLVTASSYQSGHQTLPSEGSFVHFQFPPGTFNYQVPFLPYEMIVFQYQGELYFFGNCVARCLEFKVPHVAIADISPQYHHFLPEVGGIFLKQDGINALIGKTLISPITFLNWLTGYVNLTS